MSQRLLILAEGRFSPLKSKTANAAIVYIPDRVAAVIDSGKAGMTAQQVLGYGGNVPVVKDLAEGLKHHPTHLLIGIAPTGGRLPDAWRGIIKDAIKSGLHILSGLHTILSEDDDFSALAREHAVTLTDYRKIPFESEVVSKGSWRTRKAKTILTVGTDCNIGKMTTIVEVQKEFVRRGLKADFVATGQTGILLRGRGIAVDAIISDYIAGSIEREVDRSESEGFDFILIEGQGALTHMGYSGVTFGLIHGTMPDAMILCHQPARLKDDYGLPLPDLKRLIRFHEDAVGFFRPSRVVAVGINSVGLTDAESRQAAAEIERQTGIPAVDAFRFGAGPIVDALLKYFDSSAKDHS